MYEYEYLLFGGAAGPGKSYILRWALVELLMYWFATLKIRNIRVGLFCENYPALKDRHVTRIQHEFPEWLGKIRDSLTEGFVFQLNEEYGGGFIALRNLDDPAKYASAEFAAIGVDELTKNKRQTFEDLRFRKRWAGIDHSPFMAASNPGSLGHAWVKKLFISKDFSGDDENLDPTKFMFIPALAKENPFLPASYWKTLHSLPEAMRRAMEEGNWDIFIGQVFTEFSRAEHVIERPFISLDNCKKIICFDWGYNAPGCALWLAIAPEDRFGIQRVFCYRELYQNQKTPEEWAEEINIFTNHEKTEFIVLPHDCFARPQGGRSIASIFKKGISTTVVEGHTLAKDARKNRLAVTHQFLSNARDGRPNLYILERCSNLVRTLPELVYDETNVEDVDTRGDDHCLSGDTLVNTVFGKKRIDDLVGKIGYLWSINRLQKFCNVRQTGIEEVYKIKFGNNINIKCSGDHLILTNNGWKRILDVTSNDMIQCGYESNYHITNLPRICWTTLLQMWSLLQQAIKEIQRFGKTSQNSLGVSFWKNTTRKKYTSQRRESKQQSSKKPRTIIKRATSFIACSIGRTYQMVKMAHDTQYASKGKIVAQIKRRKGVAQEELAKQQRTNVTGNPKEKKKTIFNWLYCLPKRILFSFSICQVLFEQLLVSFRVPKRKETKIRSVRSIGIHKVYNLEVENTHSFNIENGIIVHNCYDSLSLGLVTIKQKYKLLSGPVKPVTSARTGTRITKAGKIVTPDFWEEFKHRDLRKGKNPENK